MTALEIDWDKIRSIDDVILPEPFPDHDRDGNPGEGERLWDVDFGTRVVDRNGARFLLMSYGSVQGTVILRDRYRRMFHADGSMRMKVAS